MGRVRWLKRKTANHGRALGRDGMCKDHVWLSAKHIPENAGTTKWVLLICLHGRRAAEQPIRLEKA